MFAGQRVRPEPEQKQDRELNLISRVVGLEDPKTHCIDALADDLVNFFADEGVAVYSKQRLFLCLLLADDGDNSLYYPKTNLIFAALTSRIQGLTGSPPLYSIFIDILTRDPASHAQIIQRECPVTLTSLTSASWVYASNDGEHVNFLDSLKTREKLQECPITRTPFISLKPLWIFPTGVLSSTNKESEKEQLKKTFFPELCSSKRDSKSSNYLYLFENDKGQSILKNLELLSAPLVGSFIDRVVKSGRFADNSVLRVLLLGNSGVEFIHYLVEEEYRARQNEQKENGTQPQQLNTRHWLLASSALTKIPENSANTMPEFYHLCRTENGRRIIHMLAKQNATQLVRAIPPAVMQMSSSDKICQGVTLLFFLISSSIVLQEIAEQDALLLRWWFSAPALTTCAIGSAAGNLQGVNALWALLSHPERAAILEKLSSEFLSSILASIDSRGMRVAPKNGPYKGITLAQLFSFNGVELLCKFAEWDIHRFAAWFLWLDSSLFTDVPKQEEFAVNQLLFCLCVFVRGLSILACLAEGEPVKLLRWLASFDSSHFMVSRDDSGLFPLFSLCVSLAREEKFSPLLNPRVFERLIAWLVRFTPENFMTSPSKGCDKGTSVFEVLDGTEKGKRIIRALREAGLALKAPSSDQAAVASASPASSPSLSQ